MEPQRHERFGFAGQNSIYLCTQNLAKVHPDFDTLVGCILRADPEGRVVFLADRLKYASEILRERFNHSLPDVAQRIHFLPRLGLADYRCLLASCDVVLDTLHYGGVMTTYDALGLAKPIVTLIGADQRGRYATACYQQMGISDCVATSETQYVATAIRLATEPDYRRSIVEQLAVARHHLFDDGDVVPAYAALFRELLSEINRN